jgi:hypothetical protein
MLEEEPKTTNWGVVLMQGREERVARGVGGGRHSFVLLEAWHSK